MYSTYKKSFIEHLLIVHIYIQMIWSCHALCYSSIGFSLTKKDSEKNQIIDFIHRLLAHKIATEVRSFPIRVLAQTQFISFPLRLKAFMNWISGINSAAIGRALNLRHPSHITP